MKTQKNFTTKSKIYVAGHTGLVGSSLIKELQSQGYNEIITVPRDIADLTNQQQVDWLFRVYEPKYVFMCAAKVGGILGNSRYSADFITQNLQIQTNIIHSSHKYNVEKLIFLGSSCVYPKDCKQPIKEKYLLTKPLEETNEAYAIAKIAGIMMCKKYYEQYGDNFVSVMPTNLYGEMDNFNLETAHVIPALIRKFIENKKEITVWGDGKPKREFLYVDDLARALICVMKYYNNKEPINIGSNEEVKIKDLVSIISKITRFKGRINFDKSKPNGTPRKLLDSHKIRFLGWEPKMSLEKGLRRVIKHYRGRIRLQKPQK